jgi:hypothetical protein
MRFTLLLVLAVLVSQSGSDHLREAVALGRTQDEALFASFNKSYALSASGAIDRAEIVTEFRRAVLIEREHVRQRDFTFGPDDLAKAMVSIKGLVTFAVQVRLPPDNTLVKAPAYDLSITTGPASPPIAVTTLKRQAVYPAGGGPGSPIIAVTLEAAFPRADIERAASPFLVVSGVSGVSGVTGVTGDKAEVLWQARIDLSRYR